MRSSERNPLSEVAVTRVRSFLNGREYVFEAASWHQIVELAVVPQLLVWPIYTILLGGLAGGLVLVFLPRRAGEEPREPPEAAALGRESPVPQPPITGG